MLGNLDLKLLQRAFVDSDGIDYRADSSLRLWNTSIHPQHTKELFFSLHDLSKSDGLKSDPVMGNKNNFNNYTGIASLVANLYALVLKNLLLNTQFALMTTGQLR